MAKYRAFSDGSGQIKVKVSKDTTSGLGLHITSDYNNIFIDGPYVEAFVRGIKKQAKKAGLYAPKLRSVGDETP